MEDINEIHHPIIRESLKMLDFYKELIDIFASYQEFHFFKAIVVDTSKVNLSTLVSHFINIF